MKTFQKNKRPLSASINGVQLIAGDIQIAD
jgi:hypothetical protein